MKLNFYSTQYWRMKLKQNVKKNRLKKSKSAKKKIWDSILNQLIFEGLNWREKMI